LSFPPRKNQKFDASKLYISLCAFVCDMHRTPIKYSPLDMVILPGMGYAIVSSKVYLTWVPGSGMHNTAAHFHLGMRGCKGGPFLTEARSSQEGFKCMFLRFQSWFDDDGPPMLTYINFRFIQSLRKVQKYWRQRHSERMKALAHVLDCRLGTDVVDLIHHHMLLHSHNSNIALDDVRNLQRVQEVFPADF
jgi:hypothetical protein